jgi:hypothetical protein
MRTTDPAWHIDELPQKTRAGASCATSATFPWFKEMLIDALDLPYAER